MNDLTQYYTFKHNDDMAMLTLVHPLLLLMFADFTLWAHQHNLPVTITRVIDEKIEGVSISNSHAEGRAIDIRSYTWDNKSIDEVVKYINNKYEDIGAISRDTGLPAPLVHHNAGRGEHFHMQIRPQQ